MARIRALFRDVTTIRRLRTLGAIILACGCFYALSTGSQPHPSMASSPSFTFAADTGRDSTFGNLLPFALPADTSDSLRRAINDRLQRGDSLGLTDSARSYRQRFGLLDDSLLTGADTTLDVQDTTWVVYLDSTARNEQLLHKRSDVPAVELLPRRAQSIYLTPRSLGVQREVKLDSTGQFVTATEKVNGVDIRVPITVKLEDYIRQRYEEEKLNNWRTFTREYTMKQDKDALGGFLGNLTNIEIPVPANPLLSIFGRNIINLRISGAVDIRGAFRNQSTDQVQVSGLSTSRGEPDFNQQVQINVNGTVGDKLNILADWNTLRTFEYENQLKIKYTGYEDEIVQSVEAGNVSLQTPSLVGGGQALFGIKTKMQVGPLTMTSLLSQKKGQTKELSVTGGTQASDIPIYPWNYSKSYFFLDTLYRQYWHALHESQSPDLGAIPGIIQNQVVQIDVWAQLQSIDPLAQQRAVQAEAFINLPSRLYTQRYDPGLETTLAPGNGRSYSGRFIKLDPNKDYKFVGTQQLYGGYIIMNASLGENQALAVSYTVAGPDGGGGTPDDRLFGSTDLTDTANGGKFFLKLIKPDQPLLPNLRPAWDLQLKNVYSIGGRDLKPEGFSLRVLRTEVGLPDADQIESVNLLKVLGLDRFNGQNDPAPDDYFDFIPGLTVDLERADIIFPTLRPFDSTIAGYFSSVLNQEINPRYLFSEVYDTTQTAATNSPNNKYVIRVKSATAVSARYNLGFNIVEGSVMVLLNGIPLVQNTDYTVDYIVGEVVIRNSQALVPGANVQVKYEQNDLFQLASKTLIGTRGELDLFPNTRLGFTAMNLSQASLSDKVRLGEEPTSNLILGADGATSINLPFLTSAIDALPFYRTKEVSTIKFGAEAAYSIPDPNTKKSPIGSDGGSSIAYIDDFEGARRNISIDLNFTGWRTGSIPSYSLLGNGVTDQIKSYSKARFLWYNNTQGFGSVLVTDIWPNRSVRRGQEFVQVLNLDYDPNHRGVYNFAPNIDSTLHRENISGSSSTGLFPDPEARRNNWGGFMRYISSNAGSLLEQNITYLEIWMQVYDKDRTGIDIEDIRRGRVFVDLGRVSEDVIPNRELNSEDVIRTSTNPSGITRGIVNEENDLGLDMKSNVQEQTDYAEFLASNVNDPDVSLSDPSGDDWEYNPAVNDFRRFNGSDGNWRQGRGATNGATPNTEDLNNNGSVDLDNTYAEYEIPLDTLYYAGIHADTSNTLVENRLIVGGGKNGWYQFRIPLLDATRVVGGQSVQDVLQNVQYIRVWVSGFSKPVVIRVAELGLVGNQWQELVKNDTIMKASVVNIEDNPQYSSPPGVIRERDRSQPDQIIQGNEQSLSLMLAGLPLDSSRQAVKYFQTRPLDLFNYKSMKLFIHGDPAFSYFAPDNFDAEVFVRFGADTANYYEYRQPVHPGWDPLNDINIIFAELTSVKAGRDSVNILTRFPVENGNPGAYYGIRGNPSLRQIKYIGIGVTNPSVRTNPALTSKSNFNPLYGEIWANELRLTDVDNAPGYAYRFDTQLKLADLGNVAFNYSRTNPNFHGLESRFGDQNNRINWALNASIDLSKFFPESWAGTSIPLGYSHSENLTKPKYLPNTDVIVDEAAGRAADRPPSGHTAAEAADKIVTESQSLRVQDTYSISGFRIALPIQAWYIRDTFSKLAYSFTYNRSFDRDPAFEARRTWSWNFSMNYVVTLQNDYSVAPFKGLFGGTFFLDEFKDFKFYYFPFTSFSARIGAQRSRNFERARTVGSLERDTRGFGVNKSVGFNWKLTEGGLINLSGDYSLNTDRSLIALDNDSVGRGFTSILKSIFFGGRDSRYSQSVKVNTKPKIPNIFDVAKYLTVNAAYGVGYGWQNSFVNADIGKSAGFNNNVAFSMDFRLKALTDPWFASDDAAAAKKKPVARPSPKDSTKTGVAELPDAQDSSRSVFNNLRTVAKILLKIPFLDYENINITFNQSNRAANSGILGTTGFQNFWGRWPFQGSLTEYGPSRLYQLGLISDPSGQLEYAPTSSFPFFGWRTLPGLRAPFASLTDQYSQTNSIAMRTNRPLWTGATLEINWKVGWQYSKSTTITTDSLGYPTPGTVTSSGSVERSYLSFPPILFFKVFKSNLEDVGKKYDKLIDQGVSPNVALAESFEKGLEALPLLNRVFGQYVPRPNWTLRWDGIEKIAGLSTILNRLSLEHAYSSSFRRDFRGALGGGEQTDIERVTFGFTPLASVNATFKEVLKGNLAANVRMNSNTIYDLNLSSQNIVETFAQEMALSVTYSRRGFKLPLFGLNLSNDVDISFTFSRTKNTRRQYDPRFLTSQQEGTPLDGNSRTTYEPRIKYILSSRVSAGLYYRYSRTAPDEGGSTTYGTTTNEAGLDIHISI